jgi:hypothetical protein
MTAKYENKPGNPESGPPRVDINAETTIATGCTPCSASVIVEMLDADTIATYDFLGSLVANSRLATIISSLPSHFIPSQNIALHPAMSA